MMEQLAIPHNWKPVRLGDVIVSNEDTYKPKEAWPFVNYLDTGSITENRVSAIQHIKLKEQELPSRARRKAKPGDIVFSTVRPVQRHHGLISDTPENFLVSTGFHVFKGQDGLADTSYIYWYLTQNYITEYLQTVAEHNASAYPSLRPSDIEDLQCLLPPLSVQHAIARTLDTLDSKIDANQKMNETLEAMAQAIFHDWFVNFGPTRAKMEGRAPYLTPDLWNLFPDKLDDEGKPEGWHKGTLSNIAKLEGKNVDPSKVPEGTPYIGLEHMPRKSVSLEAWGKADKVTSNKSVFKKGDTLFGKLRPYFHKVGVAPVDGICSTDIIVVTPKEDDWTAYVLACLSSEEFVDYTDKTSTGTKMPRTSWKIMEKYSINIPDPKIINAFQKITRPLVEVICSNVHESRTLARTRDMLLPEVMSGKIRLSESQKHMETIS